ncbi:unnamed protein product, partial [Eretmochelys imbricata]
MKEHTVQTETSFVGGCINGDSLYPSQEERIEVDKVQFKNRFEKMTATGDEIALVGIGCNFPGGEGINNFWQVLVEGRNCTVEITPERFNTREWYDPDDNKPGKICTTRAVLIDG